MTPRAAVVWIAVAELFGTSLWFSANGVADALAEQWDVGAVGIGQLTSAVQLGFIAGTFTLALTGLADRFAAARIFFIASLVGAAANLAFALPGNSFGAALGWRFLTGLALAGIYPLGMKLVVSWSPGRAGRALGWLVGMLVLGTSLPHLVEALAFDLPWRSTIAVASTLAVIGGVIVLAVGSGPGVAHRRAFNWGGVLRAFGKREFRAAAGGYFGHMWEIYALWTIAPFLIARLVEGDAAASLVSLGAFAFIAVGALGCIGGGLLSQRFGSAPVGRGLLAASGLACLLYPALDLLGIHLPVLVILLLLLAWGISAAGDSPQFSALIAEYAPPEAMGSALAIVNGLGFLVTVISISLLTAAWEQVGAPALLVLAPGPLLGVLLLRPLRSRDAALHAGQ